MSSPEVVVDIPNREINRMVIVLAGRHRNGRLVAPKDNGHKHCSMGIQVSRNKVLFMGE